MKNQNNGRYRGARCVRALIMHVTTKTIFIRPVDTRYITYLL